jgi:hypothetical protein
VKILATPALLLAILMTFVNTAEADCRCECVDSRMRTFCSSPLDVAVCSGGCLGSVCIGFCSPHGAIAEQSGIEHEANSYSFRPPNPNDPRRGNIIPERSP